ncbi:MAG: SPFH/Band 7/PHB domain protein [Clostridiales bacterium]|jgi:regulator of protease activity HflC (stomatin/prohibitin superfamily)|nr:SPFH/Band 7/PHB domain protein [Clostridiales bacterium]
MYYIVLGVIALILVLLITQSIVIVPQSVAYIIERLGAYSQTFNVGIHMKLPFIDRVRRNQTILGDKTGLLRGASLILGVSLKEAFVDSDPQPVITKDNVTLQANTVVYYQIVDPKLYTYGAENPIGAMQLLTVTTMRNVIGELELDQTLTSRDTINAKLRSILDEATDAWGIKVNRVEVKEIEPPKTVLDAMEAQMKAEREKRAKILEAEGLKESSILKAEGEKQSAILQAEARKEAAIREAEGQAQAIIAVQKATADGLAMIKETVGEEGAIKLQSFEALVKVADGKSTKIIIPSNLQNIASVITGISEVVKG